MIAFLTVVLAAVVIYLLINHPWFPDDAAVA